MVPSSDEHLASALKRTRRVMPSSKLKNEAARARNKAARQLDGAALHRHCPHAFSNTCSFSTKGPHHFHCE